MQLKIFNKMNVTRTNHDEVSALLTVTLNKSDYKDKVEKTLINYAKNATVPGFRKGKVPLSMVKKQYEAGIAFEEINKQISEALNNYVTENNLKLVGQPVPVPMNELDYNADEISVGFEIGYEPEFSIDLSSYEAPHYNVEASEKEINKSIENMQKRFADKDAQEKITKDSYVALSIAQVVEADAEGEHNHAPNQVTVSAEQKEGFALVKGSKVGDVIKLTKTQLTENEDLAKDLSYDAHELGHIHHEDLEATVVEIFKLNLAELNQELFDKLFGPGIISSIEELKAKIKEDAETQFAQQADQKFLNDVTESLIENTKFDLPASFLKKWMKTMGETPLTDEQIEEEYAKAEKGLRFQLIEGRVMADNKMQITFEDLKAHTAEIIKKQMAQFGQLNPSDEEVAGIVARVMGNQDEVKRLSEQVMSEKMLGLYKEKVSAKTKEVNYEQFIKEMYGE